MPSKIVDSNAEIVIEVPDAVSISIDQTAAPQYNGVIALVVRRRPEEPEIEIFLTHAEITLLARRLLAAIEKPNLDKSS